MYMYIASGCVSHPSEECDPPTASVPGTEGATRKSKRGTNSRGNPRGVMLIIACNYTGTRYMHITSGCVSCPEECDSPTASLPVTEEATLEYPREVLAAREP